MSYHSNLNESDNCSINSRNSNASNSPNQNSMNLEDSKKQLGNDANLQSANEANGVNGASESKKPAKVKKAAKKKGFFSSLRKQKVKKGAEEPIPESVGDNLHVISQSNPKGMVTIAYLPPHGGNEMEVKLLISMNTTSRDLAMLCLDYLGLNEDVKCYYIATVSKKNRTQSAELSSTDAPLMVQHKWNDEDENQFELRNRVDGFITIENEDLQQNELISYKLGISAETTARDVIPVVLKIFDEKEDAKYFGLAEVEDETCIPDNTLLLGLPLHGRKCNVFKLINTSPHFFKQRKMSFDDLKQVEDKIMILEQQVDKLSILNEEYSRSEEHLVKENDKLKTIVRKQGDEVLNRKNEIKALQEEIISLNQNLRPAPSPASDGHLKTENEMLKHKISELHHNVKSAEEKAKSLNESNDTVEKKYEEAMGECQKKDLSIRELKDKLELLQEEKRKTMNDTMEQMNKLHRENKDYLQCMKSLENKLSETEQRLAEMQAEQDVQSTTDAAELRNRIESLDSAMLAKDTRILELEFKFQQKEREVTDVTEQLQEQCLKSREEVESRGHAEKRCEDLVLRMDNMRSQISEKDQLIQSVKAQNIKMEKKLDKQKYLLENERGFKLNEFQELDKRHREELGVLMEKIQNADKLLSENDLSMKQIIFDLRKDKENLVQRNTEQENNLSAKDMLIDRLESKIAKADLNISVKLKEQEELLFVKDQKIHEVEVENAKLESEHALEMREMANTIRLKEDFITKLETRFRKLETSSADNVKKFEKYVAEKDHLLQQVTSDHDQTFKDLRGRIRELEEIIKERDNKLRDANRQYGEVKATSDARLKKREKEYKRQKFLLEKILKLVNDNAPSLLRQLHDTLDCENQSMDTLKAGTSFDPVVNDEWC